MYMYVHEHTIKVIMNCLHCRKGRRNDLDTAKAKYYLLIKYLYNKAVTFTTPSYLLMLCNTMSTMFIRVFISLLV